MIWIRYDKILAYDGYGDTDTAKRERWHALAPKPAVIEAMGMMSENIERANRGESLAYTEEAFNKVVMNNGIDYNSVMSRSWI